MQITSVRYSKLVNLGNYENHKVDASAILEEGETADEALDKLRQWVEAQAGAEVEVRDASNELQTVRYLIEQAKRDLAQLRELWKQAKTFLDKNGVDTSRYAEPYWTYEHEDRNEPEDDESDDDTEGAPL